MSDAPGTPGFSGEIPFFMIINAVRYAASRQSYAVYEMCSWLESNWHLLDQRTREQIAKDIEHEHSQGRLCPADGDWERIRTMMRDLP